MGVDAKMHVDFDRDVSEEERLRWSWELCRVMGATLGSNGPFWTRSDDSHVMSFDVVGDGEDAMGDPINPRPNRRRLHVSLAGRYYGEGYERGCGIE